MSHQRNQNNSTSDVVWQELKISASMRAESKQQKPCCIWLTGLSGSGKSTVANELDVTLHKMGRHTYLLDGDNVRHGLCRDLGMTDEDRSENIRRVGEVAKLMVDAGLVVICAFISPFRSDRDTVRSSFKDREFFEVHIDADLEVCEKRDPKGLYKKARQGQIQHFTGIDSPYEPPLAPEIIVDTAELTPKDSVKKIITELTDLLEVVHKLPVDSAGN